MYFKLIRKEKVKIWKNNPENVWFKSVKTLPLHPQMRDITE